jgi:hypothetical protein
MKILIYSHHMPLQRHQTKKTANSVIMIYCIPHSAVTLDIHKNSSQTAECGILNRKLENEYKQLVADSVWDGQKKQFQVSTTQPS